MISIRNIPSLSIEGIPSMFAPRQGIEPCKTSFGGSSVPRTQDLVGILGIAPRYTAYETAVLLLNYTPVAEDGIRTHDF